MVSLEHGSSSLALDTDTVLRDPLYVSATCLGGASGDESEVIDQGSRHRTHVMKKGFSTRSYMGAGGGLLGLLYLAKAEFKARIEREASSQAEGGRPVGGMVDRGVWMGSG